jgi:uncharacterized protein
VKRQDIGDQTRLAAGGLKDFAQGMFRPRLRLGVTGLSRSGKTVFITALVNALINGARMPLFEAYARGRIKRIYLEPQPDDEIPRFAFEQNLALLTANDRTWPESTRQISQLRLTIEYEPRGLIARNLHGGMLHLDIIDYPGEWLLDLPLMNLTYQEWSASTIASAKAEPKAAHAADWLAHLATVEADAPANEQEAVKSSELFASFLALCRREDIGLSALPPGRFLMPGDLAGSPLLTFGPLRVDAQQQFQPGSMGTLMQRRYDSYVKKVVKPFFYNHFARLDRQIVLVDVLSALNVGSTAVTDLKAALAGVMSCFRQGANTALTSLFGRKVERILFAATKADQLHHTSHDRLESILRLLVAEAVTRAEFLGAEYNVAAIAAVRATREARVTQRGEALECIVGVPQKDERIDGKSFDGETEAAIFPGDLPSDPQAALDGSLAGQLKFLRFRPPVAEAGRLPHIRLDRVVEYLIGDSLT